MKQPSLPYHRGDQVMPNEAISNAAALVADAGLPEFNRRLTDKILVAFTHAYSVGETEVAERLQAILADVEEESRRRYPGRRTFDAVEQAGLWTSFVEARDEFRRLSQSNKGDPAKIATSLQQMKEAYKLWSMR